MKTVTNEDIEKKAQELMNSFGPILTESVQELQKFKSPEEGYFFAMELIECIGGHLRKQYNNVPQITAVLETFLKTLNTVVLDHHKDAMEALGIYRSGELTKAISERLETIENMEDVDLRPVKNRLDELVTLAKDPVTLVEMGVKAGIL